MNNDAKAARLNRFWLICTSAVVVLGGIWGFGHKFVALVMLAMNEREGADAAFAVAPVMNYLLASLGFLCLVGWAAMNGMFHDIEGPKKTMLDVEQLLDSRTHDADYAKSVME
jgi:hypothetical protein